MPRIWLAVVLFWLCGPAWALLPAVLDSNDLRLSLGPSMAYMEDPKGDLTDGRTDVPNGGRRCGGRGSLTHEEVSASSERA